MKDLQRPAPESFTIGEPAVQAAPATAQPLAIPENAQEITFILGGIRLEGVTAFGRMDLAYVWGGKLRETVSLAEVYEIAAAITTHYRNHGYVLSRAFVPAQTIEDGIVTLAVEEGYVSVVSFEGCFPTEDARFRQVFHEKVHSERPFNIKTLERHMLLLNDRPGTRFTSVLKAIPEEQGGGIMLVVTGVKEEKRVKTALKIDNSGSRYIGPVMASADITFAESLAHSQYTTLSLKAPLDMDELYSVSGTHTIPVHYDGVNLVLSAGYVESAPGYTLDSNSVESRTVNAGMELVWHTVRQRTKNAQLAVAFELQNSKTDVLGAPLSRDHTRSLSVKGHRDWYDTHGGFTTLDAAMSVGLNIPGASDAGDANLSRALGRPDYLLYEASAYRLQNLPGAWSMLGGVAGQLTNNVLLSAQQFGFGGQTFGRAYDSSEITGDRGISAMLEVRYDKPVPEHNLNLQHFIFYDIGKVWHLDSTAPGKEAAASAGIGTRMGLPRNIHASFTLAQPLTRDAGAPQFGSSTSPRFLFSVASEL